MHFEQILRQMLIHSSCGYHWTIDCEESDFSTELCKRNTYCLNWCSQKFQCFFLSCDKRVSSSIILMSFFVLRSYKWSKDDFELGAGLGRGKFGRVFVAREKKTHYMVAMKVLFKSEIVKGRCERQIAHEIEIQSRLRYVFILFFYNFLFCYIFVMWICIESNHIWFAMNWFSIVFSPVIQIFCVCTRISMMKDEFIWYLSWQPKANCIVISK